MNVKANIQPTMTHLLPSSANLDGFLPDNAAGLDGLVGRLDVGLVLAGTVLEARSSGFLWVISDLSTFLKPFVTSSPRFSSAKTAPMLPPGAADGEAAGGGGGGGGGAPGAPEAEVAEDLNWLTGTPWITVSLNKVTKRLWMYFRIPNQTSRMKLHDIFTLLF